MKITNAKFLTTVADESKILKNTKNEIAFVGRSNVGKSSLINSLTKQSNLAKTSKNAGLTKHINYFEINNGELHFVDLPGYGFHKQGKLDTLRWATLIERYFKMSPNLKCVILLIDINIDPMKSDLDMQEYLKYFNINYIVVGTKADKMSKSQQNNAVNKIKKEFGLEHLIVTSASKKSGLDELVTEIGKYLK